MNIILAAVDKGLAEAWHRFCGGLPNVSVHHGDIFDVSCDALVSPANSFGFMDGGIDMAYTQRFGWQLHERLQEKIRTVHHGELLVGAAEIIETDAPAFPFLIAAPTMRVPMVLGNTVNPYLATRAVLLLIQHGVFTDGTFAGDRISDVVQTVAFPGLGTGVGLVGPNTCAHQVRTAINEVLQETSTYPLSWADAVRRHTRLYVGYTDESTT